jgi:hypothetical protein
MERGRSSSKIDAKRCRDCIRYVEKENGSKKVRKKYRDCIDREGKWYKSDGKRYRDCIR